MMAFLLTCLGVIVAFICAALWIGVTFETEDEKAYKARMMELALMEAAGFITPPWRLHPWSPPHEKEKAHRAYMDYLHGVRRNG